jgi:hypothetical protein
VVLSERSTGFLNSSGLISPAAGRAGKGRWQTPTSLRSPYHRPGQL